MGQEVEKSSTNANAINLATANTLDLTGLSAETVAELKNNYASMMIEQKKKAISLETDNASLGMTLNTINTEAAKATQSNVSMTVTHTQTTAIGRTEAVIGNTDRAASGKLSPSAAGVPDRLLWIVGIVAVAAVIVALVVFGH